MPTTNRTQATTEKIVSSTMKDFTEVLAYLDELQMHKIKLGLEAMRTFLRRVGNPEERLRFVHVAGTNGKGSVCAALTQLLSRGGYRVGLFTSPHLNCVRERFRIGAEAISEEAFARFGNRVCQVLGDERITYFEFTTALALLWFEAEEVDLVVLETGMGGRLDATNVVIPEVAVITSVSMDHEAYLGDTLARIAAEKAGIIKAGVPVVSAGVHPEVGPVLAARAREVGAPLYLLGQDFDYSWNPDGSWNWLGGEPFDRRQISELRCSRPSLVQPENDTLAVATLLLLAERGFPLGIGDIREGLAHLFWPGRMEYFENPCRLKVEKGKRRFLLDGAHNPDGVKNLADSLGAHFRGQRLIVLWGSMVDKDLTTTLALIAPLASQLVLTRPDGERAASPEEVLAALPAAERGKARLCPVVAEALALAEATAGEGDLIVVGGSLYLLGEVRALLKGDLP